jgi:hypothetical protein
MNVLTEMITHRIPIDALAALSNMIASLAGIAYVDACVWCDDHVHSATLKEQEYASQNDCGTYEFHNLPSLI